MSKVRVYELAKELNVDSKIVLEKCKEQNVEVKNHMSSISEEESNKIKQAFRKPEQPKQQEKPKAEAPKRDNTQMPQNRDERRPSGGNRPQGNGGYNGNRDNNGERRYMNDRQQGNRDNNGERKYMNDRPQGNRDNNGERRYMNDRPQGNRDNNGERRYMNDRPQNNRDNNGERRYNNDRPQGSRDNNGERKFNNDRPQRENTRPQGNGGYNGNRDNNGERRYNNDRSQGNGYNGNRDNNGERKYNNDRSQGNSYNGNRDNNGERRYNNDRSQGNGGYNGNRDNNGDRKFNNDRPRNNDRPQRDNRDSYDKDGGFRKNNSGNQESPGSRRVGVNANIAMPDAPTKPKISQAVQAAKNQNTNFTKDAVEERYQDWHNNENMPKNRIEQISRSKRTENGNFQNGNKFNKKGKNNKKNGKKEAPREFAEVKYHVVLEDTITVGDLAHQLGKKATDVIMKLMTMGVMATMNQELDIDTATIIAEEYGATVEVKTTKEEELLTEVEDKPEDLVGRPPVITIMGHVDHGKTSLLDKIRSTSVTATEAGGITQHIGAYQVEVNGQKITFLDTPGHEAFTAMRARGAQVTDIAILVVAADDGVMPQTIEAIDHAKAAGVPIIVAINKIDKPEANPDQIKQELTTYGLISEEWGGDTIMVPVSAKKGTGIEELLEMILLVAEVGDLKANPNRNAKGKVVESKLDKGRGPVATLLVQNGTLRVGDFLIVGTTQGRIRAMFDYNGRALKIAGPSVPVEILGLNEVPEAGDDFIAVDNEKLAKQVADKRQQEKHLQQISRNNKVTLEDIFAQIKDGEVKELNIVLKADVQGSIEAIRGSLEKLGNEEVRVNIIRTDVGGIREADVMLAAASKAIIIGFNVRPDAGARKLAEKEEVEVKTYRIIYEAIDDVKAALSGLLSPDIKEVELGQAEIRSLFHVPKVGTVAGCYVTEGKLVRNAHVRVLRDSVVIHDGALASLKRFKDDVKEVATGYECGLSIERFNDLKEGDILEAYDFEEVKRAL